VISRSEITVSAVTYPKVVIDVLYMWKQIDLEIIAKDPILRSNSNICIIISLIVEYYSSKKAVLLV
jgi:hypothetical protein